MQEWLLKVLVEHKKTVLFITHDMKRQSFCRTGCMSVRQTCHVIKTLDIEFPRPRDREVLSSPKFLEYKDALLKALL